MSPGRGIMRLSELARGTSTLDRTAFSKRYEHPALVFLSEVARPKGDVGEALSGMTVTDRQDQSVSHPEVGEESLVLFLKPRFDPREGVTLGRALGNDYTVPHSSVSKSHATFTRSASGWTVTDLGSSNGTWVDGVCLPTGGSARLSEGAIVRLGDAVALFFTPEGLADFLEQRFKRA
jgi:hypothetical protein